MDLPSTSKAADQISVPVPLVKDVCKIQLTPGVKNPLYLKQCYMALCERKELVVPPEVLKAILKTTCHIQFDKLDDTLQNVLVDMLQYLMLAWPLWPPIHVMDPAEVPHMYSAFLSFIRQHLNDVVANEKMYRTQAKLDRTTDTNDLVEVNETAPLKIVIEGPAYVETSANFVVAEDSNDVLLVATPSKTCPKLTLEQLLNWPHVSVKIDLMNVAFIRSNVHVFNRFLCSSKSTASGHTTNDDASSSAVYKKSDVEHSPSAEHASVEYGLLTSYLLDLWKRINMNANNGKRFGLIDKIFEQFSKDLEEVHTQDNTVTVGTSVSFNIGGQRYSRTKTFTDGNKSSAADKAVILEEEIIPRVEYTLLKFNAKRQKTHPYGYLIPNKNLLRSFSITFTCQFCNQIFRGLSGWNMFQQHMEKQHIHEYCVCCIECNRNYEMRDLAIKRWKHTCEHQ